MSTTEPAGPLVPRETVLPAKMAMMKTGGAMRALIPETMEDAARLAKMIVAGGVQPRGYQNWEAVTIGILHGMEVGFSPMAALQSIAVINNVPVIFGAGIPAILYASGELEDMEEFFEGTPYEDDYRAVCIITRKGFKPLRREFSVARAKKAKLWNQAEKIKRFRKGGEGSYEVDNDSPWFRFPDRMLQMRARSWAANDRCADLLRGFRVREEVEDEVRAADEAPMTARQAAVASAPPPPEEPPAIAAPGGNGAEGAPVGVVPDRGGPVADDAFEDDAPPPEDPPEEAPKAEIVTYVTTYPGPSEAPSAVAKVEIDDVAFIRNIEGELKNLAIGEDDLMAKFEAICTAAEGRMEGMFPPDAGALSDLIERYRKELDL